MTGDQDRGTALAWCSLRRLEGAGKLNTHGHRDGGSDGKIVENWET